MVTLALLAVLIGLFLGLLGGGGSIVAVPILTYAAGLEAKEAIATSLLVVGATAVFALIPHARRRHVAWRTGALFALSAMAGAYAGGRAASLFSGTVLLLIFAAMMVLTALAMFRGRRPTATPARDRIPIALVLLEGVVVGAATGLVGAGGGFLVVPALVLLGGMDMHRAVGTSLLVIALKSFAAFAGYAAHVSVDLTLATVVTAGAIVGSLGGALLAHRVSGPALRRVFSLFVIAMAGYVLWRESGPALSVTVTLAALALMAWLRTRAPRAPNPA